MSNNHGSGVSTALVVGALATAVLTGPACAGEVSGKYIGNGKAAKLAYAVVVPHEPWNGEPAYTLVLSEKAASGSMGADDQAMFGKLGDALTITVTKSGKIIGTQVSHAALKRSGFSTVGTIEAEGVKIEAGALSVRLHDGGDEFILGGVGRGFISTLVAAGVYIREVPGKGRMVTTAFECELAESLELIVDVVVCCPSALAD